MKQLLYLEIPTPDIAAVRHWLQNVYCVPRGKQEATRHGFTWYLDACALTVFVWSAQRTTYLKVFCWEGEPQPTSRKALDHLTAALREAFPHRFPQLPPLLPDRPIWDSLTATYPLTVHYFQRMEQGEYDLQRLYWWEKRWRGQASTPQQPSQVVVIASDTLKTERPPDYDIIYLGGALGVIHAAMMAKLGYRVAVVERLHFGRMNREWNISRQEFQVLIDFGLFTAAEFEQIIAAEYQDGFSKFFDANVPQHLKAKVLHTPTVLNIAVDTSRLLALCAAKLALHGGKILDQTEFINVTIARDHAQVQVRSLSDGRSTGLSTRLIIDAMGSASAIAQQINQGQAFDSVCPTVGAVVEGLDETVWPAQYGDVLFSHGDISRGRQLIWELFPGEGAERTIYLFHYHQIHPQNPGSLLDLYEDFFTILPEYRHCDLTQLRFKKATFGYIPGYFHARPRQCAFDRILAIGDAAALQSPLVFTGFGSLVRNLPRLALLLDTALRHDLLTTADLNQINAYQSNIAVTWLFSKGMMVPTGMHLPPERINAMLNTFFGLLADLSPDLGDRFIKDRVGWGLFNRLALIAAWKNPRIIQWIWQMAGAGDLGRWLRSYGTFTREAIANAVFSGWLPSLLMRFQPYLESQFPRLWLRLLTWNLSLKYSLGQSQPLSVPSRSDAHG
ncbi:MAG: flavin-dependent dehydrogenase [Oscillatoriales cyanobacterium SM2_2_1]|nr:flavin-dependent dehydrogenase [Oscillatoriales cyanobacterium SM2_2_1]